MISVFLESAELFATCFLHIDKKCKTNNAGWQTQLPVVKQTFLLQGFILSTIDHESSKN